MGKSHFGGLEARRLKLSDRAVAQRLDAYLAALPHLESTVIDPAEVASKLSASQGAILELFLLASLHGQWKPVFHSEGPLLFVRRGPRDFFAELGAPAPRSNALSIADLRHHPTLWPLFEAWSTHQLFDRMDRIDGSNRRRGTELALLHFTAAVFTLACVGMGVLLWNQYSNRALPSLRTLSRSIASIGLGASGISARPRLSKQELDRRVAEAIAKTRQSQVVYEDILGEGPEGWDGDPRYPAGKVNCIVWFHQLIAESFGRTPEEKVQAMDRLRYFYGHVGFSTRKHFVGHGMSLDPDPLVMEDLSSCAQTRRKTVRLEFDRFLESTGYGCPLYRMDRAAQDIEYVSPADLLGCADKMEPGFYFMYAVASDRYNEVYGKKSGPMDYVHGIVLELKGEASHRRHEDMWIYHASTSAKSVVQEDLHVYVQRMSERLHEGYAVYRLDGNWDFKNLPAPDQEILELQRCEKALEGLGQPRGSQFESID